MVTKRTPIDRPPRQQITPEAIRLFSAMRALKCTCTPIDWDTVNWARDYEKYKPCAGHEKWWQLHSQLHDELKLPPHFWPAIEHPESQCPFPEGSPAAERWRPGEHRRQMYRDLEAADRAARRRAGPRDPG